MVPQPWAATDGSAIATTDVQNTVTATISVCIGSLYNELPTTPQHLRIHGGVVVGHFVFDMLQP